MVWLLGAGQAEEEAAPAAAAEPPKKKRRESGLLKAAKRELEAERAAACTEAAPSAPAEQVSEQATSVMEQKASAKHAANGGYTRALKGVAARGSGGSMQKAGKAKRKGKLGMAA